MTKPCWLAVASRSPAIAVLSAALLLGSCRRPTEERGPTADAGTERRLESIGASSDGVARAELAAEVPRASAPDAGGFEVATRRACRVMSLRGTATSKPRFGGVGAPSGGFGREGAGAQRPLSLAQNDLLQEGALIELGDGAELTVQATVSTREISLVGPALAEACPGGDEAIRLSYGKVTAFPGGGVRPGAEVWVVTPLGLVRFNDAKIEITVPGRDADRIDVTLVTGHATFVPATGVAEKPARADAGRAASPPPSEPPPVSARAKDSPVDAADAGGEDVTLVQGSPFVAVRPAGPLPRWVRELVAACVWLGARARDAGRLVGMSRDGSRVLLGDLAFAHVRASQRARAACDTAWAAAALAPGVFDARLRADLEGASGSGSP